MNPISTNAQSSSPTPGDEFKIPLWNEVLNFRGSAGYKDNVLLSQTNINGSTFASVGGDLVVFRLPTGVWMFNFLASADYTRYFSSKISTSDETAIGLAQATRDLGDQWNIGFGLNYMFQHQVLDLTALETNAVGEVIGHNFTTRWFTRKDFKFNWIEVEASGTRQLLEAPLDNFWQMGPKTTVGHRFSDASDITLGYQWTYVMFDTRSQVSAGGVNLPGTALRLDTHTFELGWHQAWDAKKRWHSSLTAAFDLSQDNGSGYFDYYQYRLASKLEYRAGTWKLNAQCRFGVFDFPLEQAEAFSPTPLTRSYVSASLHAEKKLPKRFNIFADYSYDRSFSNAEGLRYGVNTVSLGFGWQL